MCVPSMFGTFIESLSEVSDNRRDAGCPSECLRRPGGVRGLLVSKRRCVMVFRCGLQPRPSW